MAEKEERILISTRHYSEETKMTHTDMFKEYSRQEAINRMAKAFFKSWYGEGFEQEDTDLKRRYKESAEAALNALLEGK